MSAESEVVVRRRGRTEIERLVVLYRSSGMGSYGMALSTLKKQQKRENAAKGNAFVPRPSGRRGGGRYCSFGNRG